MPPPTGRPRSTEAHRAILESTRELLATVGYDRLTIDGIAAGAGVSRQTVYRWWPSKAPIVAEAVIADFALDPADRPPDTGDIRADLRAWISRQHQHVQDPAGAALLRGLTAAAADRASDAGRLYEVMTGPLSTDLVARLERAVEHGQLRPDANLRAAVTALLGSLVVWLLTPATDDRDPGEIVDLLLRGMGVEVSSPTRDDSGLTCWA